jgi:hypothetical protein
MPRKITNWWLIYASGTSEFYFSGGYLNFYVDDTPDYELTLDADGGLSTATDGVLWLSLAAVDYYEFTYGAVGSLFGTLTAGSISSPDADERGSGNGYLEVVGGLAADYFDTDTFEDNLDEFLDGVDLYVDSLDFFCLPIRRRVFKACHEKGIPAVTAAPLGMGTAFLYFKPGKMSFEQYFNFQGTLDGPMLEDDLIRFLIGLSPSLLQMGYLVDESRVDFKKGIGPSTVMSCDMCAGVVGVNALKILLGRGDVLAAPKGLHFDAYKNKLKKTHRLGGNKHPIQKILFKIVKKVVSEKS